MNTRTTLPHLRRGLLLAALVLAVAASAPARAGEHPHDRKGLLLGFNFGGGSGILAFERAGEDYEIEFEEGHSSQARIGYAFSDRFALSLEGTGFHWKDGEQEVDGGVGCLVATWWPGGGGFFLRLGVGGGVYDAKVDDPDAHIDWKERDGAAGLLGLGYEWRLTRSFALGVAADISGVKYDDLPLFKETGLGSAAVSAQFNWYL
jgi:hypothetical protein